MESMATVGVPAYGYGIRYRHGLFRQEIVDGCQVELPETWLEHGNPWEFDRREAAYDIGFGGSRRVPRRERRRRALRLASGRAGEGHRLRHAGRRLAGARG